MRVREIQGNTMDERKRTQGSETTPSDTAKTDGVKSGGGEAAGNAATVPVVEVSDKDYRSFCMPCYTLEDSDCERGA